jgi:ATP phosphoribosyltransferase
VKSTLESGSQETPRTDAADAVVDIVATAARLLAIKIDLKFIDNLLNF